MWCGYFQAEADESHGRRYGHFEALVFGDKLGEFRGQIHLLADVLLQSLDAVGSHDEPQLQRAETATQRNLPVL